MTFREFMHTPNPTLDQIAIEAEVARENAEDIAYDRRIEMKHTTIRGTFTVKACNAGTFGREAARQNTYSFADKIHVLSSQVPYTLHVEAAGGASDFGFQSVEKAKATADLLWNDSTAYYITITNNDTAEVMYPYEVASALPF